MRMQILVTGSAGFFAAHLIRRLLFDGHTVTGLDLVHPSEAVRLTGFPHIWGSIADLSTLFPGRSFDAVIHLAALTDVSLARRSPHLALQRNVHDTFSLLTSPQVWEAGHVIITSSHSVYGRQEQIPTPEDVCLRPSNLYGATKAAMETLALSLYRESQLPVTIVRPSLMYGEQERPGAVVSMFIGKALAGERILLEGGGQQTRDMNYAGNVVSGICHLLGQAWSHGMVYNLGSGEEISIRGLARMALEAAGRDFEGGIIETKARAGEEGRLFLDSSRLVQKGWSPQVKFAEGFQRVVESVKGRSNDG